MSKIQIDHKDVQVGDIYQPMERSKGGKIQPSTYTCAKRVVEVGPRRITVEYPTGNPLAGDRAYLWRENLEILWIQELTRFYREATDADR